MNQNQGLPLGVFATEAVGSGRTTAMEKAQKWKNDGG
jgi:hypothetical protein